LLIAGPDALQLLLKNKYAVTALLRASLTKGADTQVYLVCSSKEPAPDYLGIKKTLFVHQGWKVI